jgi:hypothetical protein
MLIDEKNKIKRTTPRRLEIARRRLENNWEEIGDGWQEIGWLGNPDQ